jgi:hypothetical protein
MERGLHVTLFFNEQCRVPGFPGESQSHPLGHALIRQP